jgi:hypothetical protein
MNKKTSNKTTQLLESLVAEKITDEYADEITSIDDVEHDFTELDNWFNNYLETVDVGKVKNENSNKKLIQKKGFRMVASLFIVLSITAVAINNNTEAFRFKIFNNYMKVEDEYTQISKVEDEQLHSLNILPVYIPENMELKKLVVLNSISIAQYESNILHSHLIQKI